MNAKPRPSSALFTLAAILTAIAALHFAREILLPMALAILLSFLLAPLAERLERWHLGRIPSVLAVVSIAFVVLGLLGWVVTSQLIDLSSNLGQYRENIVAKVKTVTQGSSVFKGVTDTVEDVKAAMGEEAPDDAGAGESREGANSANATGESKEGRDPVESQDDPTGIMARILSASNGLSATKGDAVEVKVISMPPTPLAQVQGWLGPLMAPITGAGMVIILVLFMLLQREDQRNRLIRLFGANNIHATTEALTDIVNRVSKYLRMQFLINAGYGLCVGAGLALIGLPNAVMFGVLSFSLRFLPYIGPWISAVLPVAVAFAVTEGWTTAILVVALFVVLELLVNNIAEPLLYGTSIGVSGVGIIVAAIFWTWIWGAIGLVLAMPLTVCLVVMARYVPALRFIAVMLGDQPTLTTEERIYQRMLALDDDEVRELAEKQLETASTTEFYDNALIPALRLAEIDREAGVLSDEQQATIQEVVRELIAELGEREATKDDEAAPLEAAPLADSPRARVLCIPLRDEADKTAALILAQLLDAAGVDTVFAPHSSLTSERVASVAELEADLVIISVLPPLPQRDSRLLCRRLRRQYPSLPIVVGYWEGAATPRESHQLLAAKGDGEIVTTLAAAVDRARAIASRATPRDDASNAAAVTPRSDLAASA
jgi:predicted PurR-regulated permease PerM/CheY-like chemotaxis protein